MDSIRPSRKDGGFKALRQLAREKAPAERCDFCSTGLAETHQHLIEPTNRQLICVCEPCAILFDSGGVTKYKRVPRRIQFLSDFQLTDAQWESLMIPISLAFFFNSTPAGKIIALYPSPAGPTESLLDFNDWGQIAEAHRAVNAMQADIEGLLVNRVGSAREHFIAPMDECFKLIGLIRTHWRGLSGGTQAWKEVAAFFDSLKQRAVVIKGEPRA